MGPTSKLKINLPSIFLDLAIPPLIFFIHGLGLFANPLPHLSNLGPRKMLQYDFLQFIQYIFPILSLRPILLRIHYHLTFFIDSVLLVLDNPLSHFMRNPIGFHNLETNNYLCIHFVDVLTPGTRGTGEG